MRIVYMNPCAQMGGAETSLRELLSALRKIEQHWEFCLILGEDGPLARHAKRLGARVIVVPFPAELASLGDTSGRILGILSTLLKSFWKIARYVRRLSALLQQIDPDVVHTNGFKMHLLGALAQPRRAPLIWHIHDYVTCRPFMSQLLRILRRRCRVAIANSRSVEDDLRSLINGLEIVTIHNAIDTEHFAPTGSKKDLDALCGFVPSPANTTRVGLVATFARWKGHKVFLQALAALPEATSVRGYLVGGPIYKTNGSQWSQSELQREVEHLGLVNRVGFTGFVEDTATAMRSLDVIVHASTSPEPFGMVIIEAMACGKPVVACNAGGASELFVDGENALGYEPGNSSALTQHILRLISDEAFRLQLGRAARSAVEKRFHSDRFAHEIAAVYRYTTATNNKNSSEQGHIESSETVFPVSTS